jgi:Cd(II)/Pb(II)-responsive transcriptional regulator
MAAFTGVETVDILKIGELARRAGCLAETIRFYEHERLLPEPARTEGNFRLYAQVHLERLLFIRHCRSLDMALDEIRTLLKFRDTPQRNCGEVNALLDKHIQHVTTRIAELRALERQLTQLRRFCAQGRAAKDCGILNRLADPIGDTRPQKVGRPSRTHPRRRVTPPR